MKAVMEHQAGLAEELYLRDNPSEAMAERDRSFRNAVMEHWNGKKYAKAFRHLISHAEFQEHPRLQGNAHNVTLSDTEYFLENRELPER